MICVCVHLTAHTCICMCAYTCRTYERMHWIRRARSPPSGRRHPGSWAWGRWRQQTQRARPFKQRAGRAPRAPSSRHTLRPNKPTRQMKPGVMVEGLRRVHKVFALSVASCSDVILPVYIAIHCQTTQKKPEVNDARSHVGLV